MADDFIRLSATGQIAVGGQAAIGEGLTFPVVLGVGDMAWQAIGVEKPELVPADVLTADPEDWIGKPVTLGHPESGRVSQKDWHMESETPVVGRIVHAERRDKRLIGEVLIDDIRAHRSPRYQELKRKNGSIDVSIGIRTLTDPSASGHDGVRSYAGKWTQITARDHLALLPEGRGACNNSMGAGFARAAEEGGQMGDTISDDLKKQVGELSAEQLKGILNKDTLTALQAKEGDGGGTDPKNPPANTGDGDGGKGKDGDDDGRVNADGGTMTAIDKAIAAGFEKHMKPVNDRLEKIEGDTKRFAEAAEAATEKRRQTVIGRLVNAGKYTTDAEKATDDCPHTDALKGKSLDDLNELARVAGAGAGDTTQRAPYYSRQPGSSLNRGNRQGSDPNTGKGTTFEDIYGPPPADGKEAN